MSIFFTALVIVKLPLGPLRPWLAYPLSAWHRRKLSQCVQMVQPVLQKRLDERRQNEDSQVDSPELDAIEWSLMLRPSSTAADIEVLAMELMHNLWAGTSSPGGLVTDIMFQILLQPEYKGPLIREASEALRGAGHWTERALNQLPLLDSFIQEINRLYPTGSSRLF